jgi:hypothetical protein
MNRETYNKAMEVLELLNDAVNRAVAELEELKANGY